jgi:hypothetical protein
MDYIANDAPAIAQRLKEIQQERMTCPDCKLDTRNCQYCSKQPCAMGLPPLPEDG